MALSANLQLNDLITKDIDDRFCYIKYDKFDLIMMKENCYINATKLCKLGGKRFRNWIRLDWSIELIKKLENVNKTWKFDENSTGSDLSQLEMIINISNEGKKDNKYEVSGSYVHYDLIPHVCSWISASFAIKVSKIINCYMSGKYEFKLKEKEKEIDYLKEIRNELKEQRKDLNKNISSLKDQNNDLLLESRELNKEINSFRKKYDNDTIDLKNQISDLKNQNINLNQKIDILTDKLDHNAINSKYNRKLPFLVLMKKDDKNFECIRGQQRYTKSKIKKYLDLDYEIFYNIYEPNAISAFNKIKEDLIKEKKISINYNSIELINDYKIKEFKTLLKSLNIIRKT